MSRGGSQTVRFEGDLVSTEVGSWRTPFPIAAARTVGDVVIVLYEPDAGPRHRQFRNLEGFDRTGRHLWTGEHRTSETADVYVELTDGPALVAVSFTGHRCELDPRTGHVLSAEFVK